MPPALGFGTQLRAGALHAGPGYLRASPSAPTRSGSCAGLPVAPTVASLAVAEAAIPLRRLLLAGRALLQRHVGTVGRAVGHAVGPIMLAIRPGSCVAMSGVMRPAAACALAICAARCCGVMLAMLAGLPAAAGPPGPPTPGIPGGRAATKAPAGQACPAGFRWQGTCRRTALVVSLRSQQILETLRFGLVCLYVA